MAVESVANTGLSETKLTPYERWHEEIVEAEKELKDFHNRARKVVRRFLDERDMLQAQNKWFNIYYANVGIMESALYAQLPKPSVSRKFKDYEDDTARVAALIIQRAITQDLDDPRDTFDATMRHAVQDRLIPGLAAAWLRLETETQEIPDTFDETTKAPMRKITAQRVCVDYVFWQDFIFSPCRVWEERRWVGRRVYMSKDALEKRFGKEKVRDVPLNYQPKTVNHGETQSMVPTHEAVKKAVIYEIWDRKTKKVIWLCMGHQQILDEKDDPLKLTGFEPCPTPMLANITTSNCTPRPDYYMIQDQYQELDTLNNRISMLLQACKVVGVYDQSAAGIARMLNEGFDNQLIPVDNWAMFAEKNGIKGAVDWLPLDTVVQAVDKLIQNRELIKAQIYELTGISDIIRGASKASETLGAQEIKSKFAAISIKKRQDEVARFAADILRIKAEIMVKHFEPERLVEQSNIVATGPDNFKYVEAAVQMLKQGTGFEWRIQVTADSIAQADYAMEKADRIEFLTAVSSYMEKALPMFTTVPGSAPFLVSLLKWAVAGFRGASEIEGMLDKELDTINKAPPQPEKPSPEEAKAQAEQQKIQAELQADQQRNQMELQKSQQELQMKERMNQMEIRMKELEYQFKVKELELKERELQMKMDYAGAEAARKERTALMESQMGLQAQAQEHEMNLAHSAESHEAESAHAEESHEMAMAQAAAEAKAKAKAKPNGAAR